MTWAVINLIDELNARIDKANTVGKMELKASFIGHFRHIRKPSDMPYCVISPASVEVSPECMKHGFSDDAAIVIEYFIANKQENNNRLYKAGDKSGPLYNVAILLDYLEKKTSDQTVDLTVNGTAYNLVRPRVDFDYSADEFTRAVITYQVKTTKTTRGERST